MGDGERLPVPARPAARADVGDWTRDLNEIRELGDRDSTRRTAEQTTIGRFWFAVGPRTFNPVVRQLRPPRQMDLVDCARLYALTAMAGADALIAVFDGKYTYNLWRPVTAIRNADQTGNAATPREVSGCRSAIRRCIPSIRARTASRRLRSRRCSRPWPATTSANLR